VPVGAAWETAETRLPSIARLLSHRCQSNSIEASVLAESIALRLSSELDGADVAHQPLRRAAVPLGSSTAFRRRPIPEPILNAPPKATRRAIFPYYIAGGASAADAHLARDARSWRLLD